MTFSLEYVIFISIYKSTDVRIKINNDRLEIRISKELKKQYLLTCKQNKIAYSKRIRAFIENDLKKMENG